MEVNPIFFPKEMQNQLATANTVEQPITETPVVETPIAETPIVSEKVETKEEPITSPTTETKVETIPVSTPNTEVNFDSFLPQNLKGKFSSIEDFTKWVDEKESVKTVEYASDITRKLDDYIRNGGENIDSFLKVQKIDFDKLDPLDAAIFFTKELDNSDLSKASVDDLREYFIDRYKIDPDGEMGYTAIEKIQGMKNREADMREFKSSFDKLKADLSKTVKSEPQQPQFTQEQLREQEEQLRQIEAVKKDVETRFSNYGGYKSVFKDNEKAVETTIDISANRNIIGEIVSDASGSKFWQLFHKDGQMDTDKMFRAINYAIDPDGVERTIAMNAYAQGVKNLINGSKDGALQNENQSINNKPSETDIKKLVFEQLNRLK